MGNTCCGFAGLNKSMSVTNPQELVTLQNNISKCVENDGHSSDPNPINNNLRQGSTLEKLPKDKYEAFDANAINNPNNPNNDGLESSNLQSIDNANNSNNQVPNGQTVINQISNIKPVDKRKSKEIGDETLPESTNLKLHIDLNFANQEKAGDKSGKSPKRNGQASKKGDKKQNKVINLQEIKLSDETNKKLTLMKEKSEKMASQAQIKSPSGGSNKPFMRSMTINANANGEINSNINESSCYEQSEKTKKIDEMKKEFIEDKKKLEKKQSEKSISKKNSSRNNRNSPIKNERDNNNSSPRNEENENWKQEEMKRLGSLSPKKSLLKRAKTIGEELKGDKNKKKVKFKDLDLKGKKKRK